MLHPSKYVDLSDREHFRVHAQSPHDQLFISKPVLGRVSGKWSVQFTRRFSTADGGFGGVIVVSLDPTYLSRAYGGLNLGEGGGLALTGTDGIIRAGTGIYASALGISLKQGTPLGDHEYTRDGTELLTADVEGRFRKVASRRVGGYPLTVIVAGRDVRDDTRWLRNQQNYIAGATALSVVILVAVFLTALNSWRWWSKQQSLTQELALQNMRFDTALQNMGEGLCMFDAQKRLVVCNDRYAKLYRLPPELLKVGMPHSAIIAHRVSHGILKGETSDGAVKQKISALGGLPADAASSRIDELADGRLIWSLVNRWRKAGGLQAM